MTAKDHTISSGNVFADLGFPDADERLAKADLALRISILIKAQGLTQARAAEMLGVDQPKVSALVRGSLAGFSMERLMRFILVLGDDVDITIRKRKPSSERAHLHVVAR